MESSIFVGSASFAFEKSECAVDDGADVSPVPSVSSSSCVDVSPVDSAWLASSLPSGGSGGRISSPAMFMSNVAGGASEGGGARVMGREESDPGTEWVLMPVPSSREGAGARKMGRDVCGIVTTGMLKPTREGAGVKGGTSGMESSVGALGSSCWGFCERLCEGSHAPC